MGLRDALKEKWRRKGQGERDGIQPKQPQGADGPQRTAARPSSPAGQTTSAAAAETSSADAVPDESLWDRAYAGLDQSMRDKYEAIVEQVTADQEQGLSPEDRASIQQSVRAVAASGRERRDSRRLKFTVAKKTLVVGKMVAGVVAAINSVKPIIGEAVKASDAASIAWVGVSLVLPLLTRPSEADARNVEDLTKITAMMGFYTSIEGLVLSKTLGMPPATYAQAEDRVQALYAALLDYLCRSSLRFYKSTAKRVLGDMAQSDDWAALYKTVDSAEQHLRATATFVSTLLENQDRRDALRRADDLLAASRGLLAVAEKQLSVQEQLLASQLEQLQIAKSMQKKALSEDDEALLRQLYVADPDVEMRLLEKRKGKILQEAFDWILDTTQYKAFVRWQPGQPCPMLWVRGPAGTGKTMLVMGLVKLLKEAPAPAPAHVSHFFCQGTNPAFGTRTAALRSIVWQLLHQQPQLAHHVRSRFQHYQKPWFAAGGSDDEGAYTALSLAFQGMLCDPGLEPCYVVVDALDECAGAVEFLAEIADCMALSDKVRWLVSSRPEVLDETDDAALSAFRVDVSAEVLAAPVQKYISHKLSSLGPSYNRDVLAEMSREITARAENTFLWVWFVFQELSATHRSGRKRVHARPLDVIRRFPPGLDAVYRRIMQGIEEAADADYASLCKHCLDAVLLALEPMTMREMAAVLLVSEEEMRDVVLSCGSFLGSAAQADQPLGFIHQSAQDFLYSTRYGPAGAGSGAWTHADMALQSIQAMCTPRPGCTALHANMFGLDHAGPVEPGSKYARMEPLVSLRYACVQSLPHLLAHLERSEYRATDAITAALNGFLTRHYLHWVEAICFYGVGDGKVRRALEGIFRAYSSDPYGFVRPWTPLPTEHNMIRLLAGTEIACPLQVYLKEQLFYPLDKSMRADRDFRIAVPMAAASRETQPCVDVKWRPHSDRVRVVTYQPFARWQATGALDGATTDIWDLETGDRLETLRMAPHRVLIAPDAWRYAALDDTRVVVGSFVKNARAVMLDGHAADVRRGAFSADGQWFACAAAHGAVKVWSVHTGECVATLDTGGGCPDAVAVSPDGTCVAAYAKAARTVTVWDVQTSERTHVLSTTTYDDVACLCISPDNRRIAAATSSGRVQVWEDLSVAAPRLMQAPGHVQTMAFSADGQSLAAVSQIGLAVVWDVASGYHCVDTHLLRPAAAGHAFSCGIEMLGEYGHIVSVWIKLHGVPLLSVQRDACGAFPSSGNQVTVLGENGCFVMTCRCALCQDRCGV